MVVPDAVVVQTVDLSEPASVIVNLVDELRMLRDWKVVRCLDAEHVGDVVASEVNELS